MLKRKVNVRISIPILMIVIGLILFSIYYLSIIHCGSYQQLPFKGNKLKYRLIILILSAPNNLEQRDTIRKTWLSDKYSDVKHLFAIGILNIHNGQRKTLESEERKFNDLLLLSDLKDSYSSITKKVLQSFVYINMEYYFDYLLKCDDDSYALIDKILQELDNRDEKDRKQHLYWGYFNGRARVKRSGLWKETEWILCDYYLPYALGGGYIISHHLIKFIAKNSDDLKLYNSEDVSVGLWLGAVDNIERKHDIRFDTEYRSRGCSNQYLITHKQSVNKMMNLHKFYHSSGTLCTQQVQNRISYQYNWTVPPSQCCDRQAGIS